MIRTIGVGFAYKSILCYLRALWIRFTKFFNSKPQSDGRIVLKDKRESEPVGDGIALHNAFIELNEAAKIFFEKTGKREITIYRLKNS